MGDFSILNEIPEMYRHCKSTEDKDMTPFDFITDHLVNIDGLFDKHENGADQKPHTPIQSQRHSQISISYITCHLFFIKHIHPLEIKHLINNHVLFPSEYISKFFRPPIFV